MKHLMWGVRFVAIIAVVAFTGAVLLAWLTAMGVVL